MKPLPWRECGWALLFLLALAGLYVGAYYAIVEPVDSPVYSPSWEKLERIRRVPDYGLGGNIAKAVFAPIHAIDRRLGDRWKDRID